jgi:hypothetical protein
MPDLCGGDCQGVGEPTHKKQKEKSEGQGLTDKI